MNVNIPEIVARLSAAIGDPQDVLNTERAQTAFYGRQSRILSTISVLNNDKTEELIAKRNHLASQRDRLRSARAALASQLRDAADWQEIQDGRARDMEWGRQEALRVAITAIDQGVQYVNNNPILPAPLREALTDTCTLCGHKELSFPGALPGVEAEVAKLDAEIAESRARLAEHLKVADEILVVTTTS